MLVIRSEQMKVFEEAALRSFESEMLVHLAEFSPLLFKAVGEEQMREVIRFGMGRADSYGFTFRGPIRLYLELMLLFGSHFDTDPQYPWADAILTDQGSNPQMQRAALLYDETMDYQQEVAGPEDAYTLNALVNISALIRQPRPFSSENFIPAMLQEITFIHPQKADYIGEEGLEVLIRKGINGARKHCFSTVREIALLIELMLVFGHGCTDDPLYPGIARTLQDGAIADPTTRAERLEKQALIWLEYERSTYD